MIAWPGSVRSAAPVARSAPTGAPAPRDACAHCGEPIPPAASIGAASSAASADPHEATAAVHAPRFCCAGCRAVWSVLHQCGLEEYYRLRDAQSDDDRPAASPRPPDPSALRRRAEFDAPEFLARHATVIAPDRLRVELHLDGLRCGACVWLLEALPRLAPGVVEVRVDLGRSAIAIDWSPSRTTLSTVAGTVERLGYRLLPLSDRASRERDRDADRRWLVRLGVAGVLSVNAMGIAFALYGGLFHGMDPTMRAFLQWTAMGLAALSVAGPGRLFLRNALLAIRGRVPHMDLPISLALVAAVVGGVASTARGGDGVYAESVTMLVLLLLAGRFVQFRSQQRARHQVDLLATYIPGTARRLRAAPDLGAEPFECVPADALVPGDRILVPAGESAAADGVLLNEPNALDMQALTGESRPVAIHPGAPVWAGCRPMRGPMVMEVTVTGARTRAGRLMALVDEALSRRAPIVDFANRIAGWFLGAVVLLALVTMGLWWSAGPAVAMEHAVALLVVTCPCALGLATPLSVVSSIARAARRGILIKGGDLLERLASRGTIVLDKTGTLTEGCMRVVDSVGDPEALRLAAALERSSAHPLAASIAATVREPRSAEVHEVRETIGAGIRGRVDGREVAVGRLPFVAAEPGSEWLAREAAIAARGLTPVAVAVDGRMRAMLGIGDPIRAEARDTVHRLRRDGWRVVMASGDDPRIAAIVGAAVGIDAGEVHGGCTPEEKRELIARRDLPRPVLMIGDGVNDVVAMAAADVGISLGTGTRASLEVGDVCLARDGIGALPPLLAGAARWRRVVRINFGIGLGYNLVGAALAMTGLMNPLIAAVLMPLSGLMVTAIALRGPRFDRGSSGPAAD